MNGLRSSATIALLLLAATSPARAQFLSRLFGHTDPLQETQSATQALVDHLTPSVVSIEVQRAPAAGSQPARSAGAGVIIAPDGKILTSEHVIAESLTIHVTLHDGRRLRARRLGSDPRADLSVIQVDADNLHAARWVKDPAALQRGHIVFAFGNPMGLSADGRSAPSMGVVSAIARPLPDTFGQSEDRYYGEMIQCTASVGPGYSGGPLVDIHGRVVGILTAIANRGRSNESLAFAVPITPRTREIIRKLSGGEDIEYGYLGIQVRDPAPVSSEAFHFETEPRGNARLAAPRGPVLSFIFPDGPADRAGLLVGDVILSVESRPVATADEFVQLVGSLGPGKDVDLAVQRDNQRRLVVARLTRRPTPIVQSAARQWSFRGASLGEIDTSLQASLDAPAGSLLVLMVTGGSPADRAGLAPGDVVVRVNGRNISSESVDRIAAISDDCLLGLANGGSVLIKAAP